MLDHSERLRAMKRTGQARGEVIEDHFWIEKIEPGKLWLNPLTGDSVIGPIPVPTR